MTFNLSKVLQQALPFLSNLGGTLLDNRAANQAANTRSRGAQDAIALLQQIYNQQYGNLAPYANAGSGALTQLNRGMGIRPGGESRIAVPGASRFSSSLLGNPSTEKGASNLTRGASRAADLAGTGATLGSLVPGVGTAIGAAAGATVGGLSSLFHRNAGQADQITPLQSATDREIQRIQGLVDQARQSGTLSPQDLQSAISTVQGLTQQFYDRAGTAGKAGVQGTADYHRSYDPLVQGWQGELGNLPGGASGETLDGSTNPDGSIGFGELNQKFGMDQFQADPGLDVRFGQGQKAIQGQAAARGLLHSGGTMKALTRYGQEFGSNEYQRAYERFTNDQNNRFNRTFSVANLGMNAADAQNRMAGVYGLGAADLLTGAADAQGNAQQIGGQNWANTLRTGGNLLSDALRAQQRQSSYTPIGVRALTALRTPAPTLPMPISQQLTYNPWAFSED